MRNNTQSKNQNILFQTANEPVDLSRLSSGQTYMGLHAVPLHQEEKGAVEYSSDTLLFQPEWDNHKNRGMEKLARK